MKLSEAQVAWLDCRENGKAWPAHLRQKQSTIDALIRKGCVMKTESGRTRITPAGRAALQEDR